MKRATIILFALFAVCAPTVLQAQEVAFTAAVVADKLMGFGEDVLRSSCFGDRHDSRRLRFALAEMAPSTKFSRQEEYKISDWIAKALERDFQFDERRLRGTLEQIRKELGESSPSAAGGKLDGFIAIWPDVDVRNVNVIAFRADLQRCVTRSFPVGKISEAPVPDVPDRFFERAAKKLPERNTEVVVRLLPDPIGFDNFIIRAQVMGKKLQGQFVDAINDVFHGNRLIPPGDPVRPVAHAYDGKDVSGVWQARLSLTSDLPQGIKVRIDYFSPGDRPTGIYDNGYFAPNVLPQDSDPEVTAAAEAACRSVRQALETLTDPVALKAVDQKNQCPRLHRDLVEKYDPDAARRAARFEQVHRAWQALRGNHASDDPEDRRRLREASGQIQPSDKAGLQPEQRQELDLVEAYLSAWDAGTVVKWQEFFEQHRRDEVTALAQHELDVAQRTVKIEQLRRFEQLHGAWQALQDNFPLDRSEDRAGLETAVDQIKSYETYLTPDQKRELGLAREL
jgi:hypothetical protein